MRYSFAVSALVASAVAVPQVYPISQISDGQIQAPSVVPTPAPVQPISQISDGQIQAPPATPPAAYSAAKPTPSAVAPVNPISQISDGQIQAPPATPPAAKPSTPAAPVNPISQISDGQIQAPPATPVAPKPTMSAPIVPGVNNTIPSSTGAIMKPSGASPSLPVQATGAATANMVSFGGMVLVFGALLA